MNRSKSETSRVFKVTYEMVKDSSETVGSYGNLEELESEFGPESSNQSSVRRQRKERTTFENRLWENLSFSSNFSIQVLQSDRPCMNCIQMLKFYLRRHIKILLFLFLSIIILILLAVGVYISFAEQVVLENNGTNVKNLETLNSTHYNASYVCEDQLCKLKSEAILNSLNYMKDPCKNFYEFSCDNYNLELPESSFDTSSFISDDWTPTTRLAKWASVQLKRMLEDTNDIRKLNMSAINKAANFYGFCKKNLEFVSTTRKDLKQDFRDFFNMLIEWPSIHEPPPKSLSLEKDIRKLILYGVNPFVKVSLVSSKEHNRNLISLDLGDSTQKGTKEEVKRMFQTNKDVYIKEVTNAALLLKDTVKENEWAENIWTLEKKLFEITYNFTNNSPIKNNEKVVSIDELQNMLEDQFDFLFLFSELFGRNFSTSEKVLLKNVYYFRNLGNVLRQTSEKSKSDFAKWLFFIRISTFLPLEFSQYLSIVTRDAEKAINNCLEATKEVFPSSIGNLYAFKKDIRNRDIGEISEVFENVIKTMVSLIDESEKVKNKQTILELIKNLKMEIVKKKSDVKFNEANTHHQYVALKASAIENYLLLKPKLSAIYFSALDQNILVNQITSLDSAVSLHEKLSKVQIPLALLQSPLFLSIYPKYIIYSSLGAIMGHQIAHLIIHPENARSCWQDNLKDGFSVEHESLNDTVLLTELMVDSTALKTAYNSYKQWYHDNNNVDFLLPSQEFTTEQMFFINYAQTWCRKRQVTSWIQLPSNYDYHQPSQHRVNRALGNLAEFSKAFNCPTVTSLCNPL